jgi:hypothetical protein
MCLYQGTVLFLAVIGRICVWPFRDLPPILHSCFEKFNFVTVRERTLP